MSKAKQVDFLITGMGTAYAFGKAYVYDAGTANLASVWLDPDKQTPAANPYTLDARGAALIYVDGRVKIDVKDTANVSAIGFPRDYLEFGIFDVNYVSNAWVIAASYGDDKSLATIQAALAAIGSANKTLYFEPGEWAISADLTIPANVQVKMDIGAYFYISNSMTLTIGAGYIDTPAGNKIFDGLGIVSGLSIAYPQWWGAKADGANDDSLLIQYALTATSTRKGIVYLLPGTYLGTMHGNPENGSYLGIFFIYNGQTLKGLGTTEIKLADTQPSGALIRNVHIASGVDKDIVIEDVILNGNAINQAIVADAGIAWLRVDNVHHNRVTIKNVKGTELSGAGEGFHFECGLSTNIYYTDCFVYSDDTGSTSSGFSANSSTNINYCNCYAYGMSVANGFTHNNVTGIKYVNCHSYLNTNAEFNSESSKHITYENCFAGGEASATESPKFTASQSLGGASYGFVINGSENFSITGGGASKEDVGVFIRDATSVHLTGVDLSGNGIGIQFDDTTSPLTTFLTNLNLTDNTTAELSYQGGGVGYSPYRSTYMVTPTFPASDAEFTNPFGMPCLVYMQVAAGGSITNMRVNGRDYEGFAGGMIFVQPGWKVIITYTGTPGTDIGWEWMSA